MRTTTRKWTVRGCAVAGAILVAVLLTGSAGQAVADVGQAGANVGPTRPVAASGNNGAAVDRAPAEDMPDPQNTSFERGPKLDTWDQCLRRHKVKWGPDQRPPGEPKWDRGERQSHGGHSEKGHPEKGDPDRAPLGNHSACPQPH